MPRACLAGLAVLALTCAARADSPVVSVSTLHMPRLTRPPTLEDFAEMRPTPDLATQMLRVTGFVQRFPVDRAPVSQPTEVYLGYDQRHLYAVFVCFDREPQKIRARMSARNEIFSDDFVTIQLDTFRDQRRAYVFGSNPLGIQGDAIWVEGVGFDQSFDTVFDTRGTLTEQGYIVWIRVPFKSLRFPATPRQTWGILLTRDIPRGSEESFWPQYTLRIEGRLNQLATLEGLENVSPGRNIQLQPYGAFRSSRALDPLAAGFVREPAAVDGGLDAKFIFQDRLVLDTTINPDFSQVESDQPQVSANQRFELFFPEERPFFLENASYFDTPIQLFFTRRIADPQLGARLTGKVGRTSIGALVADDQSPGRRVPAADPLAGTRAYFAILRVNRDLWAQSSLGMIYTDREFHGSYNRVGGVDGRFKVNANWVTGFQAVASSTRRLDGSTLTGSPAPGPTSPGRLPRLENLSVGDYGITLRPTRHLLIDNGYLSTRLIQRHAGRSIFNNHILRSRWNYQFTPRLSTRVILQYETLLANPAVSTWH
ncbi:MAG TPA: DUF5916 domain-containing protein [Terriglobales bacterium]|nr:DUF5916 domain-containing protein [Terriglobales bacterium]